MRLSRVFPLLCALALLPTACTHHKGVFLRPSSPAPSVIPGPTLQAEAIRTCVTRTAPGKWKTAPLSAFGATVFVIDFGSNAAQIYVEANGENVINEEVAILQVQDKSRGFPVVMRGKGNILITWKNQPTRTQTSLVKGCAGVA